MAIEAGATGQETATVTVLIAAYNAETTLRRALDSVLAQTSPATQVLVVDDGSSDHTHEIAQTDYAGRVTTLCQPNAGVSAARNFGLRAATGSLIAFLDADDWWAPEKLERQLRLFADQPETLLTYTGLVIVDKETGASRTQPPTDPSSLWPQLRWTNPFIPPSSVMLRRSALEEAGGFNEDILAAEDWELWVKLARRKPFVPTPEPLTFYQESPDGLSGDADRMFQSFFGILDGPLLEGFSGLERSLWRRRIIGYQAFKAALTARGAGDHVRERAYMRQSFATWPSPFWKPERIKSMVVTLLRS